LLLRFRIKLRGAPPPCGDSAAPRRRLVRAAAAHNSAYHRSMRCRAISVAVCNSSWRAIRAVAALPSEALTRGVAGRPVLARLRFRWRRSGGRFATLGFGFDALAGFPRCGERFDPAHLAAAAARGLFGYFVWSPLELISYREAILSTAAGSP